MMMPFTIDILWLVLALTAFSVVSLTVLYAFFKPLVGRAMVALMNRYKP